jgi:hypothetical protein
MSAELCEKLNTTIRIDKQKSTKEIKKASIKEAF